MLSAKELVESKDKCNIELPSFGVKDFEPNNSSDELLQINNSLSDIKKIISYKNIKVIGSLSKAVWRSELNLAEVTHQVGSYWKTMGHSVNQKLYIYPEEALYLLETGTLELIYNEVPLSVQRAYCVILNSQKDLTLDKYRVYSCLNANGFKTFRHSEKNTVTKYEKQIEVHKLKIKFKNLNSSLTCKKRHQETVDEKLQNRKKLKLEKEINFPVAYSKEDTASEIFKKFQIFESHEDFTGDCSSFDYDIYAESSNKQPFQKSCLQLPDYRVIVHRSEDNGPDLKGICRLSKKYEDGVPVIHAIVFPDHIAFYEINPVIFPNAFDT